MRRWNARFVLAAVCAVMLTAVSSTNTPAASPSPPSPGAATQPDLGIHSERLKLAGTHQTTRSSVVPSRPLTACGTSWRVVDSPNGSWNNYLVGVAPVTPLDMWAVGNSQGQTATQFGSGDLNLTEHWNGSYWSMVSAPQPGPDDNDLNNVAAFATDNVWAVGAYNTTGFIQSEALHWNGSAWAAAAMPGTPGGGYNVLNDVTAISATNFWAVGDFNGDNGTGTFVKRTLIEQWTGSAWAIVPSPNTGTGDNVLYGVGGTAANDVWAVGYSRLTQNSPRQSLIEHYDGSTWTVSASPNFSADTLISVAAASTGSAWAVGYATTPSSQAPVGIADMWNGSTWAQAAVNEPSVHFEIIGDVLAVSSTNYWAVGYDGGNGPSAGPNQPFAMQWNGSSWSQPAAMTTNGSGSNAVFSAAAVSAGAVIWTVGTFANQSQLAQTLVETYSGTAAPTGVTATVGDQSANLAWTAPCSDGGSAITSYVVTAYDGCTIQGTMSVTGAPPASALVFTGLVNGTTYTFKVAAVNGYGAGPQSPASNAVMPSGTAQTSYSACSTQQYHLTGSNGSTWNDIDTTTLSETFTPAVNSLAVISGNADLWTAGPGYNQDIGIAVSGGIYPSTSGQPEAWKESGGFAGTFSPNAAYVQTEIPVTASTTYVVKLQWKTNKADPGTVFIGAGPIGAAFSPTRLTIQLLPATSFRPKSSPLQYHLTGSDGSTWTAMDASNNLSISFTPPSGTWLALISGNSDLWTANAGYNQDIGIAVSGGAYPSTPGQPEAWKESGGFAGTFSPNAAFVVAPITVSAPNTYVASIVWKANKADPGSIFAGAGPIAGKFSPTTLSVILIPAAAVPSSTQQYGQVNSDGTYWMPVDATNLSTSRTPGVDGNYLISGNADLWTAVAGYNQDIGIMVQGGAYGAGTLVAWKESGGFAGIFSPNAAFVSAYVHLQAGPTYTIWLVWKANRIALASNQIVVGAGPIAAHFSPTFLTVAPLT